MCSMKRGYSGLDGSRWGRRGSRRDRPPGTARAAAWGPGRAENADGHGQRNSKGKAVFNLLRFSRRKVAQPTLFGHTERRWIDMRCTHIPSHEHPPDGVTYSPDNPSATKVSLPLTFPAVRNRSTRRIHGSPRVSRKPTGNSTLVAASALQGKPTSCHANSSTPPSMPSTRPLSKHSSVADVGTSNPEERYVELGIGSDGSGR